MTTEQTQVINALKGEMQSLRMDAAFNARAQKECIKFEGKIFPLIKEGDSDSLSQIYDIVKEELSTNKLTDKINKIVGFDYSYLRETLREVQKQLEKII